MIIVQLAHKTWMLLCLCCLCLGLSLFTDIHSVELITLGRVVNYFPFFCLGIYIKGHYSTILSAYNRHKTSLILICSILFALSFVDSGKGIEVLIDRYACPLMGITVAWMASRELADKTTKVGNLFVHFGHYSLQYYLNHLLIMLPFYVLASKFPQLPPIILLLLIFACGALTSFFMLRLELQTRVTRILCGLK